jgi:hypothetical protein
MVNDIEKCEVCELPSNIYVFDLMRSVDKKIGIMTLEHFGKPHFFCDAHKRDAFVHDELNPSGWPFPGDAGDA